MGTEPRLRVGLLQDQDSVALHLRAPYLLDDDSLLEPGSYRARRGTGPGGASVELVGSQKSICASSLLLRPRSDAARFCIDTIIGVNFHWQQRETQVFGGRLELVPGRMSGVTAINEVGLEDYLRSVICSEMSADSPADLLRAHAIISRSWLLAQLEASLTGPEPEPVSDERRVLWYDREAHADFDVCADDHCQRYQGVTRQTTGQVVEAIEATRGQVLMHAGQICDARFSKCCGGVTENYSVAWHDMEVPYLVALRDHSDAALPADPLTGEVAMRRFIEQPLKAYCACDDETLLRRVLPSYDQRTRDFFRWQVRLTTAEAGALVRDKLGRDLGRLLAMEPLARGQSGRLHLLRLRGERGEWIIGKELEIRRALSPSHLYSSAFVVDLEGPRNRPEAFVLRGAGWGHGVGLCQIGAAVMAARGQSHPEILRHYFPHTEIRAIYD